MYIGFTFIEEMPSFLSASIINCNHQKENYYYYNGYFIHFTRYFRYKRSEPD